MKISLTFLADRSRMYIGVWSLLLLVLCLFSFSCEEPEDIKIEQITINEEDFSLAAGMEKELSVTVLPADAGNTGISWSSSDTNAAEVSSDGIVKALAAGETVITAAAQDGSGVSDTITVTVTPEPVLIESISFVEKNVVMAVGQNKWVKPSILPANATNTELEWSSSDTSVATVDSPPYVKVLKIGTATITATAKDGSGKSDTMTVTVALTPVESITISDGDISLRVGLTKELSTVVGPANSTNSALTWSSSNTNMVQVSSNGVVRAVAEGEATITATAKDGSGISASITVVVPSTTATTAKAQEIFSSLKGTKITTNGWADRANSGAGLSYANPDDYKLIDDLTYTIPSEKLKAFKEAISKEDQFIIISGDIDLSDGEISDHDHSYFDEFLGPENDYKRKHDDFTEDVLSNTTIIGINNARIMFGGIKIGNRQNVIIRNVTFYDAHGSTAQDTKYKGDSKAGIDALVIQGPRSNGVWIDHCKFTDGTCNDMIRNYNHDGSLDIPAGKNITVSWCEFTNHDKVMLVAGDDKLINVEERQITLHHNYFHQTTQRMPRTRGTQMHIYNNYYDNIGVTGNTGYCIGPGVNAHFIVENNYFGSRRGKLVDYYDNPTYPAIVWSSGNNETINRSSNDKTNGSKPWEPAYSYELEPYAGLPVSVPAAAGPTLYQGD